MLAQPNKRVVVCGSDLQRGHSGDGRLSSLTLSKHERSVSEPVTPFGNLQLRHVPTTAVRMCSMTASPLVLSMALGHVSMSVAQPVLLHAVCLPRLCVACRAAVMQWVCGVLRPLSHLGRVQPEVFLHGKWVCISA